MKKASVLLVALALAVFGLAACGSDDDSDDSGAADTTAADTTAGGGGGATVEISAAADGSLAYDQDSASTKAGSVSVVFDNPSSTPHDVTVEDESGTELGATDIISDSSATTTLDLKPGSYTFFCSVPGHREAGMQGTITVN